MRAELHEWSRPEVRRIVDWALPGLRRRLADTELAGPALEEAGADWVAEAVRDIRRRVTSGELGRAEISETTLAQARRALYAELFALGRLQPLLDDEDIQDIHVNGHQQVFVELSDGTKEQLPPVADSDEALIEQIQLLAARQSATSRSWDRAHPDLDLELRSGHRLHAVMVLSRTPVVAIRRHGVHRFPTLDRHVAVGSISEEVAELLAAAVKARLNLVVAGGTGAGKTTLLSALLSEVAPNERIVTIEDTRELQVDEVCDSDGTRLHPDAVSLETRTANSEQQGSFTLSDLLRTTKRLNPDRVIVGEVRDAEAADMVDAMLGSAGGSLCTVHASSAVAAIHRLRTLMIGQTGLDGQAALESLCDAVDLVVHVVMDPTSGDRYVSEVIAVDIDRDQGRLQTTEIFAPGPGGRAAWYGPPPATLADWLRQAGWRGHPGPAMRAVP